MAQPGSVRTRVRRAIVGTVALALLLLGVPLAGTLHYLFRGQAETRLDAEAARVLLTAPTTTSVLTPRYAETSLGVYDGAGDRVAGRGPAHAGVARQAARSRNEVRGVVGGDLVVAVPFGDGSGGTRVVRAASPYSQVRSRTYRAWALTALLGLVVLGVAWFVGSRRARALARPFEQLTADAQALGRGNFGVSAHVTGLVEADAAGIALEETANRIERLLDRERAFSADASHQLRTPLTRLRLGLESALLDPAADRDAALADAVTRLDGLERTVASLLLLAREERSPEETCDVGGVVRAAAGHWAEAAGELGRALTVRVAADVPLAACRPPALRQVLDVLVDNALRHGGGPVEVAVREAGSGVAVDVTDTGPGLGAEPERAFERRSRGARGHGIGLSLARSLTEAEGGRLVVTSAGAHPTLSVLLPAAEGNT